MRVSAADDFAEEAEKKTESLGRALTREEVEELFLARDAVLMDKASRKEIDEGHLPHDTREKIYRPHRPKAAPAARKTRTAAQGASVSSAMEQSELDEIKADVKRSGVKAAERAAKQAVAAALGIEFIDEAPEEAADMAYPAAAAAMNATCAVHFAASAEGKEMKQWRTKVDADSAETKKTNDDEAGRGAVQDGRRLRHRQSRKSVQLRCTGRSANKHAEDNGRWATGSAANHPQRTMQEMQGTGTWQEFVPCH